MGNRHGQAQRLDGDPLGPHGEVAGPEGRAGPEAAGADLQVGGAAVERQPVQLVADVGEPESHRGVRGPEAAEQVGHQP